MTKTSLLRNILQDIQKCDSVVWIKSCILYIVGWCKSVQYRFSFPVLTFHRRLLLLIRFIAILRCVGENWKYNWKKKLKEENYITSTAVTSQYYWSSHFNHVKCCTHTSEIISIYHCKTDTCYNVVNVKISLFDILVMLFKYLCVIIGSVELYIQIICYSAHSRNFD